MLNNDILRRIRHVFDFNDTKMIGLFRSGGTTVTRDQLSVWMKKEEEPDFVMCDDSTFSTFLNGLIIGNRGAKENSPPAPDARLTNNMILMKLKIALDLKSEDMLEIVHLAEFRISKHELSAFFRKPGHKHYRECLDQFLRNFLSGMTLKYRGKVTTTDTKTGTNTGTSANNTSEK
jgi:uncharacterized protein YehS (DUF1456 family)